MKKYIILESWQNGCDNGKDQQFATYTNEKDAETALRSLGYYMITVKSIGDEFGTPKDNELVIVERNRRDGHLTMKTWTGKEGTPFESSEHRREFRIIEVRSRQNKKNKTTKARWEIVHEEETNNPGFRGFFRGIISDGRHFLFYATDTDDSNPKQNICMIFSSLWDAMTADFTSRENCECWYTWTPENDQKLLDCLNNLEDENDFCGEGSPIRTLKFSEPLTKTK